MSPTGAVSSTSVFFAGVVVEPPILYGLCFIPATVWPTRPPRSLGGSSFKMRPPSATLSGLKSGGPDFCERSGPGCIFESPCEEPPSLLPTAPLLPSVLNGLDLPSPLIGVVLLEGRGPEGPRAWCSDLVRLVGELRSRPGDVRSV